MAERFTVAIIVVGMLLAGCATPTPGPIVTPTEGTPAPTATRLPPTEAPTATLTDTTTATPLPTATPRPTETPTPTYTPTPRPTATPTPRPEDNQVVFGIPHEALRFNHCGDAVFISQDHDAREGYVLSYWELHPNLPKPPYAYRSRDQRRNMDVCTIPGYPITFEQEAGRVTNTRPADGVMAILITKGKGVGFELIFGHVDMDLDPATPGIQYLTKGTAVRTGDLIAYTGTSGIGQPEPGTPTNIGLIKDEEDDYYAHQEMMYIGLDGVPNILW